MRSVVAVLRKDLLLELRTRETVIAMGLFVLSATVMFRFALDRKSLDGDLASGVLLVTVLLGATLGIGRLFVAEREDHGFEAFRLSGADATAMWAGKLVAILLYLLAVQVVAVPAFAVLLRVPVTASAISGLILVLLLLDLGLAAVGTVASALSVQTRTRELLVPLLALPLSIPLVIACANLLGPLLVENATSNLSTTWLAVALLYDAVFLLVGFAIFEFLLED